MNFAWIFMFLMVLVVSCALLFLLIKLVCDITNSINRICCRTNTVTPTTSIVVQQHVISIVVVPSLPELTTHIWKDTEDTMCVICQWDLEQGDNYCKLKCGHNYHKKCINRLLKTGRKCPICRENIC
jgi:hypothetical protein